MSLQPGGEKTVRNRPVLAQQPEIEEAARTGGGIQLLQRLPFRGREQLEIDREEVLHGPVGGHLPKGLFEIAQLEEPFGHDLEEHRMIAARLADRLHGGLGE
jgi:hypothetical protein